jgi:hypothetical protein
VRARLVASPAHRRSWQQYRWCRRGGGIRWTGTLGVLIAGAFACADAPAGRPGERGDAGAAPSLPPVDTGGRETILEPAGARPPAGISVRPFARVERDTLIAGVIVANRLQEPAEVDHGVCPPVLRVYTQGGRTQHPAWRSDAPAGPLPLGARAPACVAAGVRVTVTAGNEYAPLELQVRTPVDEILGDSLPAGLYRIGVIADVGESPRETQTSVTLSRQATPTGTVP